MSTKEKRALAPQQRGRATHVGRGAPIERIPTRIGALEFTHDFADGYPTEATVQRLFDERDFQRACQAYLWSLPAVSFAAWQRGIREGLGARNAQLTAILSYEARRGILTANATTPYYLAFADLTSGPLVIEIPPDGIRGGVSDGWQREIPDTDGPGTYLVLAPGQEPPEDAGDYALRRSRTCNVLVGMRLTDTDPTRLSEVLAQLRVYLYACRGQPPQADILDAGTRGWSGMPPRGIEYWERLDDVIQREPLEPRDVFFHAMLRPLGIEKGRPFQPDARQSEILSAAALVGEAMAKANSADRRFDGARYRPDAHWDYALQLDADDPSAFWDLLDQRAAWFYEAVGAAAGMAPKRPGPNSAYLSTYRDSAGRWLDGGRSYRLRVPPRPPVNLFWSVTVYDVGTRALILNEQRIPDRSSRMELQANSDGSVDIHCGPSAPPGFEANWIPTVPGKSWFVYFRFYEPTEPYFDRSWPLPDFEEV